MSEGTTSYPTRADHGWASSLRAFREASPAYVRSNLLALVPDASPEQVAAWDDSIPPLQHEVGEAIDRYPHAASFDTVLEYRLPLNHRRPDVLFLMDGSVVVVEAKSKEIPTQADIDQVAAYARDLKAYHESCAEADVRPVLLLMRARGRVGNQAGVEVVGPDSIDELIDVGGGTRPIRAVEFLDPQRYRPLPSLIKAARELFETGDLRRVRRASAATSPAIDRIRDIAHEAARTKRRFLVLVTGSPGTGKTLVGLSVVHARYLGDLAVPRSNGQRAVPAVFLSGNGPLVEVLQYELQDAGGGGKVFVRDVKSYVERYLGNPALVPGEHVVVFDEAQRAWDAAKVAREHGSFTFPGSEPEHLLEFAERIPEWSVVVGLIGSGQEIHDGEEAGIAQWRQALERVRVPEDWTIAVGPAVAGGFADWTRLRIEPELELHQELRYHTAALVHEHVAGVLETSEVDRLCDLAGVLEREGYHLRITRAIDVAKRYLRERYMDNPDSRYGLVASSRDRDLPRFGVFNDWNATKNVRKGPWFCDPPTEPRGRSCCSLIDCVTEFGCQGLELDATLLAWGTDFIREDGRWANRLARRYQHPHLIRDAFQLRVNAYRVLLTRGRDASVVFVPPLPLLDETFRYLLAAGFRELDDAAAVSLGAAGRKPAVDEIKPLATLLREARGVSGLSRMSFRDPIASYGASALDGLVAMANSGLAAFAIRTITAIGERGDKPGARAALLRIDRAGLQAGEVGDLETALLRLSDVPTLRSRPVRSADANESSWADPQELVLGRFYRRKDLHAVYGGSRQTGISYPAGGEHVLLFSGGTGRSDYGYEDHWLSEDRYAYYGEWSGTGDMALTRGNARLVERSPNLFLFLQRPHGYEFVGQFACESHAMVSASRDGRPAQAIVFQLRRVGDRVAR